MRRRLAVTAAIVIANLAAAIPASATVVVIHR